jgi:hypothetical protein
MCLNLDYTPGTLRRTLQFINSDMKGKERLIAALPIRTNTVESVTTMPRTHAVRTSFFQACNASV